MKQSTSSSNKQVLSAVSQLETLIDGYVKKAPSLPDNVKEILVKLAPYFTILGIVLSVPAVLALIGISAVVTPLVMYTGTGWGFRSVVSIIVIILMLVLEIMAVPGLFARKRTAWNLLFYISLINVVSTLLSMNVFGLIIGTAIEWYFLFQVRDRYK